MPSTRKTRQDLRPSSSAANSQAGAVLCIPNTTMGLKKSLPGFSPKRACPSRRARLESMLLAPLEGDAPIPNQFATAEHRGTWRPFRGLRLDAQQLAIADKPREPHFVHSSSRTGATD